MRLSRVLPWIVCASLAVATSASSGLAFGDAATNATPVATDPLTGNGDVHRNTLTAQELFSKVASSAPLDDTAAFALPAGASSPTQSFQGSLTLNNLETTGNFKLMTDIFQLIPPGDSPWKHLPRFQFQFVQNGSYLIPVQQGLLITGSRAWNYIVGPGRAWQENADNGYTRAAFPFSLIQRNQNCVHNGEMTFLFSNIKKPNISKVYFQITQETCYPMKFDLWGEASATYTAETIPNAAAIENDAAEEIANRIPAKPFSALARDYPDAGISLAAFTEAFKAAKDITTYGLVIHGTHYVAPCPTRYGLYAFCENLRLPSYSTAKSAFAGVAMMRLGQLYGARVYDSPIQDYVPEYVKGGSWSGVTFANASDMATGNYNLDGFEADEDGPAMNRFLADESYDRKIADAFAIHKNHAPPGTKWVYQSAATFILTQAMNAFLKRQRGANADIFNLVRDDIYQPIHLSRGGLTTIRTGNSVTGAPSGYYGMFFIQDDVAKLGNFLNTGNGVIGGKQVLDPARLSEALFRNPTVPGLPVQKDRRSASGSPGTLFYKDGFWGKTITPGEFPSYGCSFRVAFLGGYGGITIALLPNGVTYYVFADADEWRLYEAIGEIHKIAPLCR